MSVKRVLLNAPIFVFTLATGVALFTGTSAVAAYWSTSQKMDQTAEPVATTVQPIVYEPVVRDMTIATVEPSIEEEPVKNPTREIYIDGTYSFFSEELPKPFRELGYIEITTLDYEKTDANGEPGVPIPPKGLLYAGREFKFSRIGVNGKLIAFQTKTVNGVSYKFTGEYLALDYCETDGPTPDITGELIKIVNGKWAASMKAKLYAECGC